MSVRFLCVLLSLFLIALFASNANSQTPNSNGCTWPQASDLPLQRITTLTGLHCDIFELTTLFPSPNSSLIITDSIITNTIIFPSNFALQNASIKFINTKLRVIRQRDNRYMLLLPGASLEFHNCTVIPPNQHQPAEWSCNASKCAPSYYDPEYYAQGLQLMIAQNSSEYDIIIKGCTYRFVSEDKSFLLNASWMPYGFGIKIQTAFNDSLFNHSFRNIHIVDNYFETNHGAMDFFLLQFDADDNEFTERQLTGSIINISGNTVVMRQIEGDALMLHRATTNVILGPQVFATLQLRYMFLDDNNVDVRGVTLKTGSTLTAFRQGVESANIFFGMKQLSVSRNKVVMSPTFSYGLYRGLNSSGDPQLTLNVANFLSIQGLNHVDEIIVNDNDVFFTTSVVYGLYLHFKTNLPIFTNGKTPIAATSTSNIGNVTISRNKVECRDTLRTSIIDIYCYDLCEHFESFFVSHNNISAVIDQRNSNFTFYVDHEFRGIYYQGVSFDVGTSGIDPRMRDVALISATYNTIHLEGMPQLHGVTNRINLQDCKFLEYSFNNVTLILDDNSDRPVAFATATNSNYESFGYCLKITANVLRISKFQLEQNTILLVSKSEGSKLVGIDVVSDFDFRLRPSSQTDPAIVPTEFKNRPELIYKNASIWNNTVKMLVIGKHKLGLLLMAVRAGAFASSIDIGYFYIFENIMSVLTYQPSSGASTNGISITTSGFTRNVSEVIISNNKIRVSGASGTVSGVYLQASSGADPSSVFTTGTLYIGDSDTRNFKKMVVENNDIHVSNLKKSAAAISLLGAGVLQVDDFELRNNTVLLTSRGLTEFFGSDPIFAPYSSFAGIDTSEVTTYSQDQHSYFYALCPYGSFLDFFTIATKNGLAVSVGKLTIENEKITLEKSGSFFATRLGFYITDSLNVQNVNMQSLGIADSTFRRSVVSSIFSIDSSSLAFQGLEYFSSVFPRISKINISNSIFSIQLPSSCGDILNSNDKTIINNQLSFINILPAPSTAVATTIVGDLIIQNVSFTQDCSASSNTPQSTSPFNNIINIPKAATSNTHTSVNVTELNIFSLPNTNFFLSESGGNLITSTSTSSSSTSAKTAASIVCTSWNDNVLVRNSDALKSISTNFVSESWLLLVKCQRPGMTLTKTNSRSDTSAELFSPSTTKSRSLIANISSNNTRISFFSSSLISTASAATIISGFVATSASAAGLAVRTRTILSGVEEIMMNDCGSPFTEETFEAPPPISASPTQFYISGPKNGGYATGLILGDFFFLLLVVGAWFGCFAVMEKYVKAFVLSKMKSTKNNNNYVETIFSTSFAAKSKVMIPAVNFGLMFLDPMFNSSIALLFIKEVGMGWKIIGVFISILLLLIGFFFVFVIYKLLVKRRKIEKFHKFHLKEFKTLKNILLKLWYFFMGAQGEWMCPKVGKRVKIDNNDMNNKNRRREKNNINTILVTKHDEELWRLVEPVIDGFTNRFPRFAIVDILTILSLAFALVIGHATANCTAMGVLLLFPVAVHLLLVIFYRPDQELLLRIFIPVTDLLQLFLVGLALGGGDEDTLVIFGTVLVTLQMILSVLCVISVLTSLIDAWKHLRISPRSASEKIRDREEELHQIRSSSHLDQLLPEFGSRQRPHHQRQRHHEQRDKCDLTRSTQRQFHFEPLRNRSQPKHNRNDDCRQRTGSDERQRSSAMMESRRQQSNGTLFSFYVTRAPTTVTPKLKTVNRQNANSVVESAAKDVNDPRYRNI